jgi:hypothetical protein
LQVIDPELEDAFNIEGCVIETMVIAEQPFASVAVTL